MPANSRLDPAVRLGFAPQFGRGRCGRDSKEPVMPIVNRVADLQGEIAAWRHDIHAHPELLYDVHRTRRPWRPQLKAFGCDEVVSGIAARRGRRHQGQPAGRRPQGDRVARPTWMRCRSRR